MTVADLAAGDFSAWRADVRAALRGERSSEVACGDCTACCTSSQFVHIAPEETGTLSRIPPALLFPAPGRPAGHVVLGYDERGHCPMLVDGRCSIYEHRPRTCRTYDCRVLAAAGLDVGDDGAKAAIAARTRRWRFDHPAETDQVEHAAVRAAAAFLVEHADRLPARVATIDAAQRSVLAVEIADVFVERDEATGVPRLVEPELDAVGAEVRRRTGSVDARESAGGSAGSGPILAS